MIGKKFTTQTELDILEKKFSDQSVNKNPHNKVLVFSLVALAGLIISFVSGYYYAINSSSNSDEVVSTLKNVQKSLVFYFEVEDESRIGALTHYSDLAIKKPDTTFPLD